MENKKVGGNDLDPVTSGKEQGGTAPVSKGCLHSIGLKRPQLLGLNNDLGGGGQVRFLYQ